MQHALELLRREAAQVGLERALERERLVDVAVHQRQLLRQQLEDAPAHARLQVGPPRAGVLGRLRAAVEHGGGAAHQLVGALAQQRREGVRL